MQLAQEDFAAAHEFHVMSGIVRARRVHLQTGKHECFFAIRS